MSRHTTWLVVPAAGQGKRMGAKIPKQYLTLQGKRILEQTLTRLYKALPNARLVLCLDADDHWFESAWVPFNDWQRVAGGTERMDSVLNALRAIDAADDDLVLVHDVARPCVAVTDLMALEQAARLHQSGALLAMPVADTMKRASASGAIAHTESRENLWHALTPQGACYGVLRRALELAQGNAAQVTDEASALEAMGEFPQLVSGRRDNIKITHPDDLALAAAILSAQQAAE